MSTVVGIKGVLKEVLKTKSGLVAIILLVSITTVSLAVPFYAPPDVIKAWNTPTAWLDNPKCAAPKWVQLFTKKKLPETIIARNEDFISENFSIAIPGYPIQFVYIYKTFFFDYYYDDFPSEFVLNITTTSNQTVALTIRLKRPDGDILNITSTTITKKQPLLLYDSELSDVAMNYFVGVTGKQLNFTPQARIVFFAEKGENMANARVATVLKGRYTLEIIAKTTDPQGRLYTKFVLYGKVYGLAGTDSKRRDLLIGLLWGAPVALAFGLAAALAITLIQSLLGVISGYFGGKVDEVIQRLTELMMIIPVLPILILIMFLYRVTIWLLLLIIIGFGIVGSTTKTIRSMVPSIKEEQYILAAKSYGASSWRIVFRHVFPRVLPYTFSLIALGVPAYIFLEASLSYLGLGDPVLPTWGKILGEAQAANAAYFGYWWWIILPAVCIMITATAFALLGYAFDKIVNPRLREI